MMVSSRFDFVYDVRRSNEDRIEEMKRRILSILKFVFFFEIGVVVLKLYLKFKLTTTAMSSRVEGHAKIGGPECFVNCGKIQLHLGEWFHCMLIRFDSKVSHLAQPEIHSLCSELVVFTKIST